MRFILMTLMPIFRTSSLIRLKGLSWDLFKIPQLWKGLSNQKSKTHIFLITQVHPNSQQL